LYLMKAPDSQTPLRVAMIDVYVLRPGPAGLEALVLRRAEGGRSPGSWECIHGHIDQNETPVQAARRELAEEAGFETPRLYNLSRVDLFYSHRLDYVALIPAFVAVMGPDAEFRLSEEHDDGQWLRLEEAKARVSWPRLRRGLEDAEALVGLGGAGPLDDVLRV
jgi:8-oxo-dGTP pyrophosphatase MutT (NUDIX family)